MNSSIKPVEIYNPKPCGQRFQKTTTAANISTSVTANIEMKASPYSWATLYQSTAAKSSKTVDDRMCRRFHCRK